MFGWLKSKPKEGEEEDRAVKANLGKPMDAVYSQKLKCYLFDGETEEEAEKRLGSGGSAPPPIGPIKPKEAEPKADAPAAKKNNMDNMLAPPSNPLRRGKAKAAPPKPGMFDPFPQAPFQPPISGDPSGGFPQPPAGDGGFPNPPTNGGDGGGFPNPPTNGGDGGFPNPPANEGGGFPDTPASGVGGSFPAVPKTGLSSNTFQINGSAGIQGLDNFPPTLPAESEVDVTPSDEEPGAIKEKTESPPPLNTNGGHAHGAATSTTTPAFTTPMPVEDPFNTSTGSTNNLFPPHNNKNNAFESAFPSPSDPLPNKNAFNNAFPAGPFPPAPAVDHGTHHAPDEGRDIPGADMPIPVPKSHHQDPVETTVPKISGNAFTNAFNDDNAFGKDNEGVSQPIFAAVAQPAFPQQTTAFPPDYNLNTFGQQNTVASPADSPSPSDSAQNNLDKNAFNNNTTLKAPLPGDIFSPPVQHEAVNFPPAQPVEVVQKLTPEDINNATSSENKLQPAFPPQQGISAAPYNQSDHINTQLKNKFNIKDLIKANEDSDDEGLMKIKMPELPVKYEDEEEEDDDNTPINAKHHIKPQDFLAQDSDDEDKISEQEFSDDGEISSILKKKNKGHQLISPQLTSPEKFSPVEFHHDRMQHMFHNTSGLKQQDASGLDARLLRQEIAGLRDELEAKVSENTALNDALTSLRMEMSEKDKRIASLEKQIRDMAAEQHNNSTALMGNGIVEAGDVTDGENSPLKHMPKVEKILDPAVQALLAAVDAVAPNDTSGALFMLDSLERYSPNESQSRSSNALPQAGNRYVTHAIWRKLEDVTLSGTQPEFVLKLLQEGSAITKAVGAMEKNLNDPILLKFLVDFLWNLSFDAMALTRLNQTDSAIQAFVKVLSKWHRSASADPKVRELLKSTTSVLLQCCGREGSRYKVVGCGGLRVLTAICDVEVRQAVSAQYIADAELLETLVNILFLLSQPVGCREFLADAGVISTMERLSCVKVLPHGFKSNIDSILQNLIDLKVI